MNKLPKKELEQTENLKPNASSGGIFVDSTHLKYIFTVSEAAKYLEVSADTLRNWEASGKLVPKRTKGGSRRYNLKQLNAYLFAKKPHLKSSFYEKPALSDTQAETSTPQPTTDVSLSDHFFISEAPITPPLRYEHPSFINQSSRIYAQISENKELEPYKEERVVVEEKPKLSVRKNSTFKHTLYSGGMSFLMIAVLSLIISSQFGIIIPVGKTLSLASSTINQNLPKIASIISPKPSPKLASLNQVSPLGSGQVLAASSASSSSYLEFNTDVKVNGNLSANNIVNSIQAGAGVSIDNTDPNNPVISTSGASSGVTTLGKATGDILLGTGLTLTSSTNTLGVSATLSQIRSNGGCSGCITSDDLASGAVSSSNLSGTVTTGNGGTGLSTYTAGDILYANASGTLSKLGVGTAGQALTVSSGLPEWTTLATGVSSLTGGTSGTALTGSITISNSTSTGSIITLDNALADGSTKGIAAFNSTNFTASSGVINTIQNIATTSSPSFAGLTLSGNVLPSSTDTVNIGTSSSNEFNTIYAKSIVADGITLSGSSGGFWSRDTTNGYVYTTTSTDKVGIGTSAPGAKLDVESTQTSGNLVNIAAPSAITLTSTTTGLNLDLSTHITATGKTTTGVSITPPSSTGTVTGINIGSLTGANSTTGISISTLGGSGAATGLSIGNISSNPVVDSGTGADGDVTFPTGTDNINTTAFISGRTCADAPDFAVSGALTVSSSHVTISVTTDPTTNNCIAVGDEVLIINLQGTSSDYSTVGTYETETVTAVSSSSITVSSLTNSYGGTQKIMVQRVPNYHNVTINGTLTANTFNGTVGGVIFFRSDGTTAVDGSISVLGIGYNGGLGASQCCNQPVAGQSILGTGSGGSNTSDGASGGTGTGGAGAAGGYSKNTDSSVLKMGGGGGGGGSGGAQNYNGGNGGNGGGIAYISAATLSVAGTITADGHSGNGGGFHGGGGGGAGGGTIDLLANNMTLGTNLITSAGGSGGAVGSSGISGGGSGTNGSINTYSPNTISGTTSPTYGTLPSSASTSPNDYGILLGTLTGGTTSNNQIATGNISAVASATQYQLNLGGVTGTANSSTNYGINLGAISATGTSVSDYGINVGAISGAGTTNYGINIGTVSGATSNYALITNGGLLKNNSTSSIILSNAALATSATDGFTYIPTSAGAPTGTPTSQTGTVAMEYDTTNNKLMIYNGSWKTTTGFADYAEWAPAPGAEAGDVVTLTDIPNPVTDNTAPFELGKSSTPYNSNIVGVVSKYAEDEQVANGYKKSDDYRAIALVGRVPVKVSTINGPIHTGDFLTSSSIPGVAMKASSSGEVIGKATQDYINSDTSVVGEIIAFINPTFADPSNALSGLFLDDTGKIIASPSANLATNLSSSLRNQLLGLGTNSTNNSLEVPNLDASSSGALASSTSTNNSIFVDPNIDTPIPQNDLNLIASDLISVSNSVASGSATLVEAKNTQSVLGAQVASQSAQINSLSIQSASTSAQLANLQSQSASTSAILATLLNKPISSPGSLATGSASLADINVTNTLSTLNLKAIDATLSGTLTALGPTTLASTTVAGDFSVDGTMSLTGNSINSIGLSTDQTQTGVLYLQNSPLATLVDFFNGLVTIDKDGTLKAQKLAISSQTLGQGVIPSGQTQIVISAPLVSSNSEVFVTPTTPTGKQSLIVTKVEANKGFSVEIESPYSSDIKFNWWVVDQTP